LVELAFLGGYDVAGEILAPLVSGRVEELPDEVPCAAAVEMPAAKTTMNAKAVFIEI
jgi:hypothetical protein